MLASYDSSKRVVVVANGNSSNDIAAQLAPVARPPIYRSIRHPAPPTFVYLPDSRIVDVASITRYRVESASEGWKLIIHLEDGSEISSVDEVIVGTGYAPAAPFVRVLGPSQDGERKLTSLTPATMRLSRIPSLHRHILYAHNTTLAFIGAIVSYTPFIISDVSSTWLTLAWAGEIQYPDTAEERLADERDKMEMIAKLRAEDHNPSSFIAVHVLGPTEEPYAQGLRDEIVKARPGLGTVLPVWSEESRKEREEMYPRKLESLVWLAKQRGEVNASKNKA